jgi:hypothetical protein
MANQQKTSIVLDDDAKIGLNKYGIPQHMHEGVIAYFEDHRPVGDFLRNILSNDFVSAAAHADDMNKHALYNYCQWLFMCAPGRIYKVWGSHEIYKKWLEIGRKKREKDDDG